MYTLHQYSNSDATRHVLKYKNSHFVSLCKCETWTWITEWVTEYGDGE